MREDDVVVGDDEVVGRVKIDKAGLATAPERHPGMGCVGAFQARLSFRRQRADVTADIGCGQAESTQAGNHDVGEILTDAAALLEGLRERGSHVRRLGIVAEITADAAHEFGRRVQHRASRGEAFPRVIDRRLEQRDEAARVEEVRRRR